MSTLRATHKQCESILTAISLLLLVPAIAVSEALLKLFSGDTSAWSSH